MYGLHFFYKFNVMRGSELKIISFLICLYNIDKDTNIDIKKRLTVTNPSELPSNILNIDL